MAQAMFLEGTHNDPETQEMFIRKNPFKGEFTVVAGLAPVIEWIAQYGFSDDQLAYLASLKNTNGTPRFKPEFLELLKNEPLQITIDAMPEGEIVFPNEPIVRISGPAWQVNLVESAFLQSINSASLIATKAARIKGADEGKIFAEFGLRRAQNPMMASRSAIIGGFNSTSNVDAGFQYGIPVSGTHAHSFIMRKKTEQAAFESWLKHNPDNAMVLIDTYDTINGIKLAIEASKKTGVPLMGVRLDSGDLAALSIEVRQLLDAAGMKTTKIVASNDLNEYKITELKKRGAKIDFYGVGTDVATGGDQPALGGVYKLKKTQDGKVIKCSEDPIKTTIPGATETIRILSETGNFKRDVITTLGFVAANAGRLSKDMNGSNMDGSFAWPYTKGERFYKPMRRMVSRGKVNPTATKRSVMEIAADAKANLAKLDASHKRITVPAKYPYEGEYPTAYPVDVEIGLFKERRRMIEQAKQKQK